MLPDVDDVQLLLCLQSGDRDAFWTLWIKHSSRLRALCLREMNGNRVDAEDALHEAMLRAHDRLPRFAACVTSPASWLTRTTSNVCNDIHRRQARGRRFAERLEVLDRHRVEQPDVSGGDGRRDDYDPATLVALLPDRLRAVFVLRVLERTPYQDIAARLGLTPVTARKRVQQSRDVLREWRRLQEA